MMDRKDILARIEPEVWKQSSFIIACKKCGFYMWVKRGGKFEKEEINLFKKLSEKKVLECPFCRIVMDVMIDVEKENEMEI